MRRLTLSVSIGAIAFVLSAPAAYAQQSVNFYLGGFVPQSFDSRDPTTDVLVRNGTFLATFNRKGSVK